jgi:nitric oxide reductase activation protein
VGPQPTDIDVSDPLDLVEDARRTAVGLRAAGVDAYCVVLGQAGIQAAGRIFGRGNTMMVHRVEDLPGRLSELGWRRPSDHPRRKPYR